MRKVIYSMGVSVDGFVAGPDGEIDWAAPDEELHQFYNEQTRELGAHLLGRKLYEVMLTWETGDDDQWSTESEREFADIWRKLPKLVFSNTLETVEGNATLVQSDAVEETARLKEQTGNDVGVGGAGLASALIRARLVDEYRLFISPVALGGGTPFFPVPGERMELELVETRTFTGSSVEFLRYRSV